jgi:hypothetical protein
MYHVQVQINLPVQVSVPVYFHVLVNDEPELVHDEQKNELVHNEHEHKHEQGYA